MLTPAQFSIVAQAHPFRPVLDRFELAVGASVEDAIVAVAERAKVDLRLLREAACVVGDVLIPKAYWAHVRPHATQRVVIAALPGAPLLALLPVIAGYAASAAIPTAFALLHPILTAVIIGAVTVVASLVATALSPTPKARNAVREDPVTARYSIQGVRNEARPYGVIPRIFGRVVNYYPVLAAQPYTEIFYDDNQYMRVLFDIGYGPVSISDLKIGTTPIAQMKGIEYEFYDGANPAALPAFRLFPNEVREEQLNIQLKYTSGFTARTTQPQTDEVSLDIIFPGGLQRIEASGVKLGLGVRFEVQYRAVGTSTWLAAPLVSNHLGVYFEGPGVFRVDANDKSAVRRSVRFVTPVRGQYEVQVRRLTIDNQELHQGKEQSITTEDSYWAALRSFENTAPVFKPGIARLALRLQATDQLNGTLDQLNCTVQALLPVWDGAAWSTQVTRSPAWAFADVLIGRANARPVTEARLDLDALLAWDTWATAQGFTFDGVFATRTDIWSALQDIAGTCCASPTIKDGLYSVVVDNARDTVVQHFSPRNSRNFKSTRLYANRPHALKVRFPNELTLGQMDELVVYEDGYTAATATVFEALDLPYTTSAQAAWKRARRAIVAARLRPEIYQFETDIEHLPLSRGDLVRVVHDVPEWGVSAARVKSLATSGPNTTGVVLDAPVTMDGSLSYALRVRLRDSSLVCPVVTVAGDQTALTLITPVTTATGPQADDLALFGVLNQESVELIVRSIEPGQDCSATLTLVDYAPEIQTSDSGPIPAFDPQITLPAVANRATPPVPAFTSIDSSEAVLIRASDGTLTSRILVGYTVSQANATVIAESVQARYRPALMTQDYSWLSVAAQAGSFSLVGVQDGLTYEIQLRSVSRAGAASDWTQITHTVIGKTSKPPAVDQLYRQGDKITWPYPDPPIDLAGFLVRAAYGTSQDWGMARALHAGVWAAPPFDISDLHGTQTILVKAVDTSGNEADSAAHLTIDLGDLFVENVIQTQSEAPAFTGTITGGVDAGTQLQANLLSSPPFWHDDPAVFWGADGALFWQSNVYDTLTYTARFTPASDQLHDATLKIAAGVTGDYTIDYRISTSGTFWGAGGSAFWGADLALFWDPDTVGEFATFPGMLGPFESTADTYEFMLTVAGGAVQGIVSQLDLIVDVPDIVEYYEDVVITVAASGVRLTPAAARRAIDIVNLTLQDDGGSAITLRIMDKNPTTGALIKAFTSAGAATTAKFDARTKAH